MKEKLINDHILYRKAINIVHMERRVYIASATTVAGTTLAGCSNLFGQDGPEEVTESYLSEYYALQQDDPWDDLDSYLHPTTRSDDDQNLEIVEIEADVLDDEMSEQEFLQYASDVIAQDTASLQDIYRDEGTALVEASTTLEVDGDEENRESQWLLATYEGEWLILARTS